MANRMVTVSASALLCVLLASVSANAQISNIEVINVEGDATVVGNFIGNAHLDLPTLQLIEDVFGPPGGATGNEIAWWDVEVRVTQSPTAPSNGMISIDKDVLNLTDRHWSDFHISIGTGVGAGFVVSDEFDSLFFKNNPGDPNDPINPINKSPDPNSGPHFKNPPMMDETSAPDELWWFADPPLYPGLDPGEITFFWLGVQIPQHMFDPNTGQAVFTIREHASVPLPNASVLVLPLVSALGIRTRRRR